MNVLKPKHLSRGDTIGVVATSFPFPANDSEEYYLEYQKGITALRDLGFRIKEGNHLRRVKWWFAGTPKERASDINDMYADPEIRAIIVHEGGQSAIAVLEHIDYALVKDNPKPFIGFSDVTSIHLAMFTQTGLVGFQGPLLTYSLGKIWGKHLPDKRQEGLELLYNILTSTETLGEISPLTPWEC